MTSNQPHGSGDVNRGIPSPSSIWQYDYPGYFAGGDLRVSVFTPTRIVLAKEFEGTELVALDPATGAVAFTRPGVAALRGEDDALVTVEHDGADQRVTVLADGTPARTVVLTPAVPAFPPVRFVMAGPGRLLVVGDGELAAYELATGAQRWRVPAPESRHLFAPIVLGDRVIMPGATYAAYALADGKRLWRQAGVCCGALASPDGAHVYLLETGERTVELSPAGAIIASRTGTPAAVSRDFVALRDAHGVSVYRHGGAAPILRVDAPDGLGAVALADEMLFYFDGRDATVWMHDVVRDVRIALHQATSHTVISPDASGTAPPFVSDPPIVVWPNVYVLDWTLHAYRVDRG